MSKKTQSPSDLQLTLAKRGIEGLFIFSIALAAYLLIALVSYDNADPAWSQMMDIEHINNAAGLGGAWLADILFSFIGYVAYSLPVLLLYRAWLFFRLRDQIQEFDWIGFIIGFIGLLLVLLSLCGLAGINSNPNSSALPFGDGGALGDMLGTAFYQNLGLLGGRLILFALLFIGMTIFANVSWMQLIEKIGYFAAVTLPQTIQALLEKWRLYAANRKQKSADKQLQKQAQQAEKLAAKQAKQALKEEKEQAKKQTLEEPVAQTEKKTLIPSLTASRTERHNAKQELPEEIESPAEQEERPSLFQQLLPSKKVEPPAEERIEPQFNEEPITPITNAKQGIAQHKPVEQSQAATAVEKKPVVAGELPELSLLLQAPTSEKQGYSQETLDRMSRLLEEKLADFRIQATVTDVLPGPVVTRFEVEPAPGVKVSTISNLAKDIARSLAVMSVRVVEVIAGKTVIGIEIPNEDRQIVYFSEVVGSEEFEQSKSPLSLALGHDIAGEAVVADLAKMPHLLVAGTTGSGKSVGVNAMLLSMLFKAGPDEVRLILVDPKMLELSIYEGIPHLLTPVITDMKDASNALRWCVAEMERRYKLLAKLGVRNIAGYNTKIREAKAAGEEILDPLWKPEEHYQAGYDSAPAPALDTLPFIVVVIDEFADMMMVVGKKVEELIARIAQKARAAGIHLILATQRPSVDIITGLIKANVPTRMAFQVSSKIDSRTILDQGGAEQLLGHGDMLYMPPGTSFLTRVHGAFVDDDDVHNVVASWKERGEPDYIEGLLDEGGSSDIPGIPNEAQENGDAEADPLYDEAVAFVLETRKASISSVQRKLRIGYNRSARLLDAMEEAGIVSGMGQNGQREILIPESNF